ncbi:DNA/RNA polymerase, partial [Nadsonia fulvescens var. elongata DSM 6958]
MPDGNEKVLDQGILTTIETGYIEQDGDLKYQDEMALCSYFETGDGAQLWGIKDPSNLKLRYNSPLNQEKQLKAVESYQGSEEDLQSSEVQGQGDLYQGPEKLLDKNWNLIQIEDKKELFMSDVFGQVQTAVPLIPGESESHLYDNEIYKEFGFGDFNTYLKNKRAKLQINDREIVRARLEYERDIENEESNGDIEGADEDKYPPIFKNKTIYLNGHTDPPPAAIHRMIILHGGIFVVNPAAIGGISKVDYIVCGQVAAGKKQKWTSAGYRLVKPEWVLESIKARKILNWGQFRVVDIADTVKTHRLNFQPLNDDGKTLTRDYNKKHSPGNASKPVSVNKRKVLTTDPDFIAHYYSKSRLHHLSTWKANLKREFQQRVLEKTELSQQANSTPLPPSNMSHPIILHIDLDCFFASVGLLERPHISPLTAVGVSHGAKHSSVASCNYVARKFGVSNGMSVGRARQLCPGIVLLPYDFNAYEKASRAFYEVVLSLDARLVYPVSVDEVLVDVTNIVDAAVKDEDIDTICTRLGNAIRNQVKCVTGGCEVSIGGSVNILLAKLCLRRAKPRGQFFLFPNDMSSKKLNFQDVIDIEVHAGPVNNEERKIVADEGIKQFLVPLELKSLPGVGPSLVKSLAPLVNVNQLRQASLRHLTQALGVKRALGLYWAARGVDRSNLNLREVSQRQLIHSMKQKAVSVEISWGVRLYSDGDVRVFVENLCKEVIGRLKLEGDNYGGRRIGIKLYKTLYSEKELVRLAIGDDVGEEDLQDSGNEIDEGETPNEGYRKPMGHGPCTYHVKATTVPSATNDLGEIFRICWSNISSFGFRPVQIRGIGVSIGLLQDMAPDQGYGDKAQPSLLQFFLKKGATPKTKVPNSKSRPMATQEVDWEVFEALPASLRTELIEQDIVVNRKVNVQMSRELVSTPRPNEKVVLASDDIDWEAFSQLTSSIKRDIDRE